MNTVKTQPDLTCRSTVRTPASSKAILSLLVIPIALSLSACATKSNYVQPVASQPGADLVIVSNHQGTATYDIFNAYDSESCTKSGGGTLLASFNEPLPQKEHAMPQKVRVWPDKRIYLRSVFVEQGAVNRKDICTNVISFIPEPSRQYKVKQVLSRDRTQTLTDCKAVVTTLDTGQAVASFQSHEISKTCKYHQ